jgi:hypothetical protein
MALEEQLAQAQPAGAEQAAPQLEEMNEEEEIDLQTAVLMAERMLQEEGFDVIEQAIETSSDPAQVIGQFLLQMIMQMDEAAPNDSKFSRRIWLAKGGWLEQVMDIIIDEFQLDYAIADKAEVYVAQTASEMAKAGLARGQQAQQQGVAPGQATPTLPQGGPV